MQRFAAAAVGQVLYYEARLDGWGCCARWGVVANEGVPLDSGIVPRSVSGRLLSDLPRELSEWYVFRGWSSGLSRTGDLRLGEGLALPWRCILRWTQCRKFRLNCLLGPTIYWCAWNFMVYLRHEIFDILAEGDFAAPSQRAIYPI